MTVRQDALVASLRVAVVGGGLGGLAAALFLARAGHSVTIVERDSDEPAPDAWATWRRPGVPQLRQFHGFTVATRSTLVERAPDVYETLLARGAIEVDILAQVDGAVAWPGDPPLVALLCRRTTLEPVLRTAVQREPNVTWRTGAANDLTQSRDCITGVIVGDEPLDADLVVDATGRRARSAEWLDQTIERHPAGLVYFTRWYKRISGKSLRRTARHDVGRYRAVLQPADNEFMSMAFMVATSEAELRQQLRHHDAHHELAMSISHIGRWIAPEVAEPMSDVFYMGGLENTRWWPEIEGLVTVGDAAICTNPFFGRGTGFAFVQAAMLADDPATYLERARCRFDPWFEDSVARDDARTAALLEQHLTEEQRILNELPTRALESLEGIVAWMRYAQSVGHPSDLRSTVHPT